MSDLVLTKGENISLQKNIEGGLETITIGLAWDEIKGATAFDADAVILMLDENGKLQNNDGVVYYGLASRSGAPFSSKDGSVKHSGDNLTGSAAGDDEVIKVDLKAVPANIHKLEFIINIHQAKERGQNFGQVDSCKARAYDDKTGAIIATYDLVEDFSGATAVKTVQLYRHDGSWKLKAIGVGIKDKDLKQLVEEYK